MKIQLTYGDILNNSYKSGKSCPLAMKLKEIYEAKFPGDRVFVIVGDGTNPYARVEVYGKPAPGKCANFHYNGQDWDHLVYEELFFNPEGPDDIAIELELTEIPMAEDGTYPYVEMVVSEVY